MRRIRPALGEGAAQCVNQQALLGKLALELGKLCAHVRDNSFLAVGDRRSEHEHDGGSA